MSKRKEEGMELSGFAICVFASIGILYVAYLVASYTIYAVNTYIDSRILHYDNSVQRNQPPSKTTSIMPVCFNDICYVDGICYNKKTLASYKPIKTGCNSDNYCNYTCDKVEKKEECPVCPKCVTTTWWNLTLTHFNTTYNFTYVPNNITFIPVSKHGDSGGRL
jgi:hypothetical protein